LRRISAEYAENVSPKPLCSGLVCALLLAACGGSSHSSTSASTAPAATNASATSTTSAASATTPPPQINTTTATKTKAKTKTTVTLTHTSTPVAPPPVAGPRVPATYTILPNDVLSPPSISVPAGYRVQLTFRAHGARVTVLVLTPHRVKLNVSPGGEASKVISGLPKGAYPIVIAGAARGSLVIGSAPGP
jgi:hypothetical protein